MSALNELFHGVEPMGGLMLLDGFALRLHGREQNLPLSVQRVVANIALRGRPSRLSVAGQLWPDTSDERAQGNLRAALHRLQCLCPGAVHGGAGALWLDDLVKVDVRDVTHWAMRMLSGEATAEDLAIPDVAYTGELLPGWYDDWVELEREQFKQLRLHALEALCDRLTDAGHFGVALYAAYSAMRAEPLRESAHRAVIRIHLAEGNLMEAARQYRAYRELLFTEMSVEPTPLMQTLVGGLAAANVPGLSQYAADPPL